MPIIDENRHAHAFVYAEHVYDVVGQFKRQIRDGEGDIDRLVDSLNKYASHDYTGKTPATPEQWAAIGYDGGEAEIRRQFAQALQRKETARHVLTYWRGM